MRMRKIHILLIIIFFLGGIVFLSFPFLFKNKIYYQEVSLERGKVMIISDLHLDSNPRDLSCIGDYLEENDVSLLVFNGDLFDMLHREEFKEEFLEEAIKRLDIEESSVNKIIYILALYNHDPYLKESKYFEDEKGNLVLSGILKLKTEEELLHIFHGDYVVNSIGIGVLTLVNKFASPLFYERLTKRILQAEEWIILGHSHVSGIDYDRRIANSGTWINRIFPNTDTAILIEAKGELEPKVDLVKIPCD